MLFRYRVTGSWITRIRGNLNINGARKDGTVTQRVSKREKKREYASDLQCGIVPSWTVSRICRGNNSAWFKRILMVRIIYDSNGDGWQNTFLHRYMDSLRRMEDAVSPLFSGRQRSGRREKNVCYTRRCKGSPSCSSFNPPSKNIGSSLIIRSFWRVRRSQRVFHASALY